MSPGQFFSIIFIVLFLWAAYTTARYAMVPYFAIMTAVIWLGVVVGLFAKIIVGIWK